MDNLNILIIEDDKVFSMTLRVFFKRYKHKCYFVTDENQAFEVLKNNSIDIVLLGFNHETDKSIALIKKIKENHSEVELIAMAMEGDLKTVVRVYRAGASDYLFKPFQLSDLAASLKRTARFASLQASMKRAELNYKMLTSHIRRDMGIAIIGVSAAMKKLVNIVSKVAQADNTAVLITGESGTGKELIARGIHAISQRNGNMFHSVNCSSVPESLFEAEFFGHTRGAFTGATNDRKGWFEVSQNSTLFLDEVGELPLSMQAKFLRVLDNKVISRIGEKSQISLDLRVIAATNQNLIEMVNDGRFRVDLYHRLSSFEIHIPPLRERREDIPELVNYYVQHFSKILKKPIARVEQKFYTRMQQYDYPGNVRELKNLIEQAVITCEGDLLKSDHLYFSNNRKNGLKSVFESARNLDLSIIERNTIEHALQESSYNKSKAAKLLNISRQALDRKIQKYDIPCI